MQIASICILTYFDTRTDLSCRCCQCACIQFISILSIHITFSIIFHIYFLLLLHMWHMHEHATSPPLLKQKIPILLVVPKRINTTHHPIRCMRSRLSLATYTPLSCHIYIYTCLCLSFSTLRVCLILSHVSHCQS